MANKPAQRRALGTERKRRAAASRRKDTEAPPPSPISLAGIGELPAADHEPGTPDPDDVADPDLVETARPTQNRPAIDRTLAAGDLDADFHGLDSGEETPAGSDPTPDQDNVDEIGEALGVVEPDEQPLATTERVVARDEHRWELDPASSEDFEERQQEPPRGRTPRPRPR